MRNLPLTVELEAVNIASRQWEVHSRGKFQKSLELIQDHQHTCTVWDLPLTMQGCIKLRLSAIALHPEIDQKEVNSGERGWDMPNCFVVNLPPCLPSIVPDLYECFQE